MVILSVRPYVRHTFDSHSVSHAFGTENISVLSTYSHHHSLSFLPSSLKPSLLPQATTKVFKICEQKLLGGMGVTAHGYVSAFLDLRPFKKYKIEYTFRNLSSLQELSENMLI